MLKNTIFLIPLGRLLLSIAKGEELLESTPRYTSFAMVKWDTYAVRWTLYRKLDMLVATISLAWQVCGHQR
jgi:hypothetical protein